MVQEITAGVFAEINAQRCRRTSTTHHAHWSDVPLVGPFHGRDAETRQLARWLIDDRCQLVAVLGMGGVGKSTLVAHTVRVLSDQYDAVLWRSLLNARRWRKCCGSSSRDCQSDRYRRCLLLWTSNWPFVCVCC